MARFKIPTQEEFGAATRDEAARMRTMLLGISAHYDAGAQLVFIALNNGMTVGFPLSVLPGLENATPDDLREMEIQEGGYGLHVPSLDADIAIPNLLEDHLGSKSMRIARARAAASRANGQRGGRPKKTQAA
jgi:hypothetical protein